MQKEPQPKAAQAVTLSTKEWFALLDSFSDEPFMPEGRDQPAMPPDPKSSIDL